MGGERIAKIHHVPPGWSLRPGREKDMQSFFLPSIPLFESRSYDKRDSERGVSTTRRSRVEREYTGGGCDVFFFEFLRIMHAREMSVEWRGLYLSFLERSFVNQVHLFLRVKVTFDVGNTRSLVYK